MALFIKQNENRSELQQRIAAELQDKARKKAQAADMVDGVEDSQYVKGLQGTGRHAWIWIVLAVIAVIALFVIFIMVNAANNEAIQYGVVNTALVAYNS